MWSWQYSNVRSHMAVICQWYAQPLGHGPVPPHGMLGMGPRAGSEPRGDRAKLRWCYHLSPASCLPDSHHHPPLPHTHGGKIVFHKTCPRCQKGWGPLTYHLERWLMSFCAFPFTFQTYFFCRSHIGTSLCNRLNLHRALWFLHLWAYAGCVVMIQWGFFK